MTQKKIAVTGPAGSVGKELVRQLLATGASPRLVVDRGRESVPDFDVPQAVECSLTNPVELREALRGIDTVFHCAVQSTGPEVVRVNTDVAHHVVDAAIDARVRRLVFLSSTEVLGEPNARGTIDASSYPDSVSGWSEGALSRFYAENEVWRGIRFGLSATVVCSSAEVDARDTARAMLLLSVVQEAENKRFILSTSPRYDGGAIRQIIDFDYENSDPDRGRR